MEHQKLGDISINLRRLWLVNLICQAIGIIVTECLIIYEDSFGAVEGVNVAYLVILVLLVLHGALTKNSVGTESPSKLSVMYVPYKDLKTRANSFRSASFGMDNEHIESSADIMGKFLKFSQKQKVRASTAVGEADIKFSSPVEKKEVVAQPAENLAKPLLQNDDGATRTQSEITPRQKSQSQTKSSRRKKSDESPLFEDIYIQNYINLEKHGKSTIVYLIKILKNGKESLTRRSYSEFYKLYQKTRKYYPDAILPYFPEKKTKSESSETGTIEQRKDQLSLILKKISEKRLHTAHLDEFLKSDEVLPNFSSRPSVFLNARESVTSTPKSDYPLGDKPIVEEVEEFEINPRLTKRKSTDASSLTDADFVGNDKTSDNSSSLSPSQNDSKKIKLPKSLSPSEARESKDQSNVPSQFFGGTVISEYATFKAVRKLSDEDHSYKVEIVGAWNDKRDGNPATYYEFQVKDLLQEKIFGTSKRYSDFKVLHAQLKDYAKKAKISMPVELPNNGTLGPMVRKTDPLLIEYRKFALPNYLQTLLNKKTFQACSILLDFVEIK
eukprot:CAMPEP_0176414816 /NCGR_PEP_ID=MMETSP0127-20121128/5469_1 /TAXON_ID=938130 /ORGANISM="Platyophrya macrostoma, Strain WH" /LENGTH=554 /DNA_ID=CAMNT_0017794759 /DNA_START=354 /DNA_END=2018 /DNA_ORIENTATION=+